MTFIFSSTYVFFVAVVTFSICNISPIDCFSLRVTPHSRTKTSLHIFGKFAEAFSNDSFDKKENAGLTNVSIELEDSSILQVLLKKKDVSYLVAFDKLNEDNIYQK